MNNNTTGTYDQKHIFFTAPPPYRFVGVPTAAATTHSSCIWSICMPQPLRVLPVCTKQPSSSERLFSSPEKEKTHARVLFFACLHIFTCSRRAVHTRTEWISCIELASTRVYPAVRKSSRTNTTPRTINSGVCVRNNLRSWKGWDQKTKNLDFSVLCRCVRVVKEMDLKPIVISRAGSNPVADGDFFFPGVTSKTDTRGDGRTDILLVLHSYLVRKAQINELCRHSSYGCIEYQVHTTYTCMCTCMRTLIILNLHFLLLRGAIVNRTKYC